MFAFQLISRIVAAPWQLLRAILRLDGAQETPSARAKARSKSKASSSVAGTNTVPAKPKPKPKMSDAAKPADGSKVCIVDHRMSRFYGGGSMGRWLLGVP